MATLIYSLTNRAQAFPFSLSTPAFVISCLLDDDSPNRHEVISLIVVLISISLMASDIEHLLMFFLAFCMASLENCLFRYFSHFSIGLLLLFFAIELLYEFVIYFGYMTCEYFFLIL